MIRTVLAIYFAITVSAVAKEEQFRVSQVGADKTKLLDVFEKIKLMEGEEDEPFTQSKFVEALRDGETWVLRNYETKKCFYCFGKGNLGVLKDHQRCGSCNGKGLETIDLLVKW